MADPVAYDSWSVTAQVPKTGQTASGTWVPGVEVQYTTGSGMAGSVFVPNALFSADAVRAAIAAKVAVQTQVAALKG